MRFCPQKASSPCLGCSSRHYLPLGSNKFLGISLQVDTTEDDSGSNSNFPNTTNTSVCMQEEYMGTVCRPYLAKLQQCVTDDNTGFDTAIYVAPLQDSSAEDEVKFGLNLINSGLVPVTEECIQRLLPFVCLLKFPLVDCDDGNGTEEIYRPSQTQCESIRDDVCRNLWDLAIQNHLESRLPDCNVDEMFQPEMDILNTCQGGLVGYHILHLQSSLLV